MKHTSKFFSIFLSLFVLNGCSLLELKIESQSVPLTTAELNTRILTRAYSKHFFSEVESAADEISAMYPKDDTLHQSYVLLWKIHAEEGLQHAAYQVSPTISLIVIGVCTSPGHSHLPQNHHRPGCQRTQSL